MSTSTVGVVGLGKMGQPVARNLLSAGYEVIVHNRSQAPIDSLASEGAIPATKLADVATRADAIITLLPTEDAVRDVLLGESGLISLGRPGSTLIDMSTVSPDLAREVDFAAASRSIYVCDAPVSGGESAAIAGSLSIMVGGSKEAFAAAEPMLRHLGVPIYVGPPGSGQTVKAANQLMTAGVICAVSEALLMLESSSVDKAPALRALRGGLGANRILELKSESMLARDFTPGGRAELHMKDLSIALELGRKAGVFLPFSALASQLFYALRHLGGGDLDHTAIMKVLDSLSAQSGSLEEQ